MNSGAIFIVEKSTESAKNEGDLARLSLIAVVKRVLLTYEALVKSGRKINEIGADDLKATLDALFYPESNFDV